MNLNLTPVVKMLAIINVAVFVLGLLFQSLFHIDTTNYLAIWFFESDNFHPYQIVTHVFTHLGFMHLLFNMFALISFGSILESRWGPKRFLFFYLFCALGSTILHNGVNYIRFEKVAAAKTEYINNPSPDYFIAFVRATNVSQFENQLYSKAMEEFKKAPENEVLIKGATEAVNSMFDEYRNFYFGKAGGASGAIFGLLMAFGLLFPNTELSLLFIPVPIKAKYLVFGYITLELFLAFSNREGDNVGHIAHIGGALFGFILVKYWQKQRNTFY